VSVATRKYEQRLRAEGAEETRRRILDALSERLCEAPSEPVNLEEVARMAGVVRPTIYAVFGSRAGLFSALGADLFARGGFEDMLRASAHPDAVEALRGGMRGVVRMFAAHRDVLRVLYSMAQLDADAVGGAIQLMEEGRARGALYRAQRLAEQKALRPDVTVAEAADLLWVLTSFESFDALYTGRGLSPDNITERLVTAAERSLCKWCVLEAGPDLRVQVPPG
jgi:AcrR family transcriptional regulator